MRIPTSLALASLVLAATRSFAQPPPAPPPPPCPPADAGYVCTGAQQGPEDLVALPGDAWVIASSMSGDGGIAVIRASDRAVTKGYPSAGAKVALDTKHYAGCPGPPNPGKFTTHGLYLYPGGGPVERLLVVGHGERESIEVFNVDIRGPTPAFIWIGCAIAPEPIGLNSVRGLSDGGFITTNFLARGASPDARQKMSAGETNGELWEWHPGGKWQKIPGSQAAGANGVELSHDGKTLYMAAWGSQSFVRLSHGEKKVQRDEVPLGFRVDNIHWAEDGSLLAVGQGTGTNAQRWQAVKIDPKTLTVSEVMNRADVPGFAAGTVAAEVGKNWWIGSFRGDRIAIVPAP